MSVSRGKPINITDYRESNPNEWRKDGTPFETHTDSSETFYISAPSFMGYFQVIKNALSTASMSMYINIYKWDGQNNFVSYGSQHSISFDGSLIFSKQTKSYVFAHNKDDETADSYDNSDTHLWKIVVSVYGGALIITSNITGKVTLYSGGIEVIPQTSKHSHMWKKGSLLYASTGLYYTTSDYGSDTAFINAQKPGAYRGTPISVGTAKYAYSVEE